MRTAPGCSRPNIRSSLEKPKTNESALSISVTSISPPDASDSVVLSSRPPNPAPSTTTRLPIGPDLGLGRLGDDADVGLGLLPLAKGLLRLVVGDRAGDDHVLALLPIDRGRDFVLRGQLQRVDHPQHLVEVPPRRHRVDQDQL